MVMVWLRMSESLTSLILNTEKMYWIWSFYNHARKRKLIPKFLQFKEANKGLESSGAHLSCQSRLLNQGMSIKYKPIRSLNNKIISMKNNLYSKISFIDYVHVITKFLVSNDMNICKIRKNKGTKLHNLFLNNSSHNSVTSHNPDKVIFKFSSHDLNTTGKSLLSEGLNFAIPSNSINYAELLNSDIDCLEISNLDKGFIKSRLRDSAFSSYKDTSKTFGRTYPKRKLMH